VHNRRSEANAILKAKDIQSFRRIERFGSRFLDGIFRSEAAQTIGPKAREHGDPLGMGMTPQTRYGLP